MADLGLLAGLAEGIKQGIGTYQDTKQRQSEQNYKQGMLQNEQTKAIAEFRQATGDYPDWYKKKVANSAPTQDYSQNAQSISGSDPASARAALAGQIVQDKPQGLMNSGAQPSASPSSASPLTGGGSVQSQSATTPSAPQGLMNSGAQPSASPSQMSSVQSQAASPSAPQDGSHTIQSEYLARPITTPFMSADDKKGVQEAAMMSLTGMDKGIAFKWDPVTRSPVQFQVAKPLNVQLQEQKNQIDLDQLKRTGGRKDLPAEVVAQLGSAQSASDGLNKLQEIFASNQDSMGPRRGLLSESLKYGQMGDTGKTVAEADALKKNLAEQIARLKNPGKATQENIDYWFQQLPKFNDDPRVAQTKTDFVRDSIKDVYNSNVAAFKGTGYYAQDLPGLKVGQATPIYTAPPKSPVSGVAQAAAPTPFVMTPDKKQILLEALKKEDPNSPRAKRIRNALGM